ncbi:MAG: GNAT family N-acetyltransferase [Anaerovoracaceae bacterium]|jgi:N-acetylglutamate synthase-like GNAT family acetyltransferase
MNSHPDYKITETEDFYPLSQLFNASGMDVPVSRVTPEHTIKMWRMDDTGRNLMAALTIEYKNDCFVLENLAVREDLRKAGLGKIMLSLAEKEFRARGARRIWGCAKVPEYYLQYGWTPIDREKAPVISHCQDCDQFHESCFPIIIYKDLK